jgi:hypothetical protein
MPEVSQDHLSKRTVMKFIVHVKSYHSVCNDGHIEVEAENEEKAIEAVFLSLRPGRGLSLAGIRVEQREASFIEKALHLVSELPEESSGGSKLG